jgi:hypothetical protein
MAIDLNLTFYTVQSMLTEDLQICHLFANIVPKFLTDDQKR